MLSIQERNKKIAINRWNNKFQKDIRIIELNIKKFPLLNARLIGYFMGDGSVTVRPEKNGAIHHTCCFFPDDKYMKNSFLEGIDKIYKLTPHIKEVKNNWKITFGSKAVVTYLLKNYGSFRSLEWKLPNFKTEEELKEWLRAFFDCEAHVSKKSIQLQSVNKEGILQIKNVLERLDIKSGLCTYERKNKNWNTNYILSITKKSERYKFLKTIGFYHKRKLEKLTKLVKAGVPESG